MATCPNCGGYLGNDHRCFGAWRRIARTGGVTLAGAVFGVMTMWLLVERPSNWLLAVAGVLGAVLVAALWRAV